MELTEVLHALNYMAPMVAAIVCACLVLLTYSKKDTVIDAKLKRVHILYYVTVFLGWIFLFSYVNFPVFYVYLNPFIYFTLIIVQITFYHLIYIITRMDGEPSFPIIHYLIPLSLSLILAVWTIFVPFEMQLEIISSRGKSFGDYKIYSYYSTSRIIVRYIFSTIYTLIGFWRLNKYRKAIINFSADEERISLNWIYTLFILSLVLLITPVLPEFFSRKVMISSVLTWIPIFIVMTQYALLCYNVVVGNYVVIYSGKEDNEVMQSANIKKEVFEKWMLEKKPYLDPKLKITDLTYPLQTNRSYLSSFINTKYGMNFNQFINTYRLKELEEMKQSSEYSRFSELDLIAYAGFSNYRGYLRFINNRDKD